ncbi:MAG: D-alanyl-D-alanine carboxypeptidase [Lachnospiraceae bacterium]|jgi:D-alanyl-D-alanine carboxypeptidase (penicillin-binding protein 5/6)|nr:D-alanyl-D-alanine carboxypeptidase [Lachnospiraceae bacterium]
MQNNQNYDPNWIDTDEEFEKRRRIRQQRMEQRKRKRQRQRMIRKAVLLGFPVSIMIVVFLVFLVNGLIDLHKNKEDKKAQTVSIETAETVADVAADVEDVAKAVPAQEADVEEPSAEREAQDISEHETTDYVFNDAAQMLQIPEEVVSTSVIFIDADDGEILAEREGRNRICPASMTKILTVLVAAEQVEDLEDTFTMTQQITDYSYSNDCSSAGFLVDEKIPVKDLFYGTILPSGADAAVGLATYVAGSQEAFVELMNQKCEQLGIGSTTHFTNCVGIYDDDHYSTPYDMAVILRAAMDNELCREVMSERVYTTTPTEQHPEGITISNWFLRRIEDKDTGGEILCAKTGFVVQSGNCSASFGKSSSGREYLCVTAGSSSSWRCIYDHVALYHELSK